MTTRQQRTWFVSIRSNWVELRRFSISPCIVQGRYIFQFTCESTSGMTTRQQQIWFVLCWFNRIKSNRQHFQHTLHCLGESRASRLPVWQLASSEYDSCPLNWIESNRQHFQPTLHSPGELNSPSLVWVNFQYDNSTAANMIHVDSIKSSRIVNIFNFSAQSRRTKFLSLVQVDFRYDNLPAANTIRVH